MLGARSNSDRHDLEAHASRARGAARIQSQRARERASSVASKHSTHYVTQFTLQELHASRIAMTAG
jgi:hypothetical protein